MVGVRRELTSRRLLCTPSRLAQVHNLTGPVDVEGTEPGDVLVVDILDVQPFQEHPWGFTGIFERTNGGGLFATEFDSKAAKAIWDFKGVYATSRHIPGVRFAGCTHPGLIGTRPSKELLKEWNRREGKLIHDHKIDGQDPVPAVAFPPEPKGAYVGQDLPDEVKQRIYKEGARTIPGREHGGVSIRRQHTDLYSHLRLACSDADPSIQCAHDLSPDSRRMSTLRTSPGVRGATFRSSQREPV